jgi:hypothetical protein
VTKVSVLELKALLVALRDHKHSTSIRFRLLGKMWQDQFMRVIDVTDEGVILKDNPNNKMILLPDLKTIIQFELDGTLFSYQPHFHYNVVPD